MPTQSQHILDAAIASIGGTPRDGQILMTEAVAAAFNNGEHLLVQAGTGTGKSLGYLAPALSYLHDHPHQRVVIATATLALQAQLASIDIPAAVEAAAGVTGRRIRHAILKGRANYACLHRVIDGTAMEQDSLFGGHDLAQHVRDSRADQTSVIGAEVVALRSWAQQQREENGSGDRDEAPTHTAVAWAQVSVSARECLGAQSCPFGADCFVEKSRDAARAADLVVTNHALLAVDAMSGHAVIPAHDRLIIDEAHELVSRVTGAASSELSPQQVDRVARRCWPWLDDDLADDSLDLAEQLTRALNEAPLERVTDPDSALAQLVGRIRDVFRQIVSQLKGDDDPDRKQAAAAAQEIFEIAERMAALADYDVVWVSERERAGRWLVRAPLDVSMLMREQILARTPTVLTSATLQLGGNFDAVATSVGLPRDQRLPDQESSCDSNDGDDETEGAELAWRAMDVGSPFDYGQQGILYIADQLPPPGRDGIGEQTLAEIAELVWAAGGRTLGLFASQRNAEAAARHVRAELPHLTVLCQGDAQLSELTRRFIDQPTTSLFGTLSLWQGIDVPGSTCQLVIMDKIPFPRPDDPLMQARQQSVARAGGNGFMAVAASHAALLLAQGSGRLIRRLSDRGVVAVLDPRLRTARYGSYLRASMPPFWTTTDRDTAINALRRLDEAAQAQD